MEICKICSYCSLAFNQDTFIKTPTYKTKQPLIPILNEAFPDN